MQKKNITPSKNSTSEVRARSWSHIVELLFEQSPDIDTNRFRSQFVFRGVANADYTDLPTSLQRLTKKQADLAILETKLIRAFKKYASLQGPQSDLTWEWLAIAQHYGLPTRILDWTWSPFVALHFATDKNFEKDGVIWMIDFKKTLDYLPTPLRTVLDDNRSTMFTTPMLQSKAPTLDAFDELQNTPFCVFFEPPSLDERIANQYGLFSVMSGATTSLDKWLLTKPNIYKKIVVPVKIKWEVRDKIDQANITERVLFPGLDGLAKWLKRYYGPGGNNNG